MMAWRGLWGHSFGHMPITKPIRQLGGGGEVLQLPRPGLRLPLGRQQPHLNCTESAPHRKKGFCCRKRGKGCCSGKTRPTMAFNHYTLCRVALPPCTKQHSPKCQDSEEENRMNAKDEPRFIIGPPNNRYLFILPPVSTQ